MRSIWRSIGLRNWTLRVDTKMGDLVTFVVLRVDAMLDDLGRVPRFQSLLWYALSRTYLHSRNTAVAGRYMECAIARSHVVRGSRGPVWRYLLLVERHLSSPY